MGCELQSHPATTESAPLVRMSCDCMLLTRPTTVYANKVALSSMKIANKAQNRGFAM
jgi:hypothetical protein